MPPEKQESRTTRWPIELVAAALLVGTVWLVYGRSLDAPFICDDSLSVVENDSIRRLWPPVGDAEHPGPLRPPQDAPTCGRPLVNWTFAANYAMGGLSPRSYRAFNIFLHSLNVLLLAALLATGTRPAVFRGAFCRGGRPARVCGCAVVGTASVGDRGGRLRDAANRADGELLLPGHALREPALLGAQRPRLACRGGARMLGRYGVEGNRGDSAGYGLAVRPHVSRRTVRAAWQGSRPLYVGLFASWLLLLCLAGPGPRAASAGFHLDVSATDWWLTQTRVLLMYLKLAVWPWPLSIHYELPYLTSLGEAWLYVVPVVVLVGATLVLLWRRSAVGYLLALALAVLAPTLIVPIVTEVAAERRMYLPLAALVALAVVGGYVVLRRAFGLRAALACIVTAVTLLACAGGIVGAKRLVAFDDELTLWQDVLTHDPANAKAQYNVGTVYLERKQPQSAVKYFERAIELQPDFAQAHHNLGAVLSTLGRPDEATKEFERAVALEPRYSLARVKLGITAMQAGDLDAAEEHFLAALRANPNSAAAHAGFAGLLLKKGQLDDAIRHAQAALDAGPESADAHNTLGAALAQQGQMAAAVEHFEAAVRLDPGLLQAQGNLAAAYASLGRLDDAHRAAANARPTRPRARRRIDGGPDQRLARPRAFVVQIAARSQRSTQVSQHDAVAPPNPSAAVRMARCAGLAGLRGARGGRGNGLRRRTRCPVRIRRSEHHRGESFNHASLAARGRRRTPRPAPPAGRISHLRPAAGESYVCTELPLRSAGAARLSPGQRRLAHAKRDVAVGRGAADGAVAVFRWAVRRRGRHTCAGRRAGLGCPSAVDRGSGLHHAADGVGRRLFLSRYAALQPALLGGRDIRGAEPGSRWRRWPVWPAPRRRK